MAGGGCGEEPLDCRGGRLGRSWTHRGPEAARELVLRGLRAKVAPHGQQHLCKHRVSPGSPAPVQAPSGLRNGAMHTFTPRPAGISTSWGWPASRFASLLTV